MHFYDESIERALRVAFEAHAGQMRKGGVTPYISHPVHVALLLARHGADSITLQAALLHDVVEDCDGWTVERLSIDFGPEVADVVAQLTELEGRPWEERKQGALDHIPRMDARAAAVKASDKTHNMRSLAERLGTVADPAEAWRPFSRGPAETIGLAERVVAALDARLGELSAFEGLRRDLRAALEALQRFR